MSSLIRMRPSYRSLTVRSRLSSRARIVTLGAFLFALGACGELPSGPLPEREVPLTPGQAEEIKGDVADTQDRLMAGISSDAIRNQVSADLDALSANVTSGNLANVRIIARSAAATLATYYWGSDRGDGPDISAMLLMLNAIAKTAGDTNDDISL